MRIPDIKVVADLLSPRQGLEHIARAASVTRLVWSLAEYVTGDNIFLTCYFY